MSPLTSAPAVTLWVDGTQLSRAEVRGLEAVRVQQRLSLPAQCELVFADPPGPLSTPERMEIGSAVRVDVGEGPSLFRGQVTALEQVYGPAGQRQICVRGYDLLHRLRKRQPTRARVQFTVAELAAEMAEDLGLTVHADMPGPFRRWLVQHRRSDWELLADLAAEGGLYLVLRDGTLYLTTLAGIDEAEVPLVLGQTLLEARVEVNAESACRTVRCAGWDPSRIEAHTGQAARVRTGRMVTAEAEPANAGGSGERHWMGQLVYSQEHAQAAAQAELERRVAYEVALWGVAEGNSRLRAGTPVRVSGVAEIFAGRYILTGVTHTVDDERGYLSEFSTLPPMPGQGTMPWTATGKDLLGGVAVLGRVSAVNDPEGAGRLRATLPGLGDVETDWMHVVCPGAGPGKGLVVLPDLEDRVLVLLPQGEAGAGVVLGGLFGMEGPADSGVEGGQVRCYTFATPGGQRLMLDDREQRIRLEDRTGNVVEMSPDRVWIRAKCDLVLEAPGRSVVIRGDRIDFERE